MATDPVLSLSSLIQLRTIIHSIQVDIRYYRERKWKDEDKPEFVEQTSTNRCQNYLKISEEGFAPYLQ
jgi:hypothetical protein